MELRTQHKINILGFKSDRQPLMVATGLWQPNCHEMRQYVWDELFKEHAFAKIQGRVWDMFGLMMMEAFENQCKLN
jgi:hypothetical protein